VSHDTASVGVVGCANVDLTVRCQSLPRPGETVVGSDLVRSAGGKGANQAVAAARLGARTTLFACLGEDDSGRYLAEGLRASGIDTSEIQWSQRATGTALIAVDAAGENIIVVSPGANDELAVDALDLSRFDLVLAQLELPEQVALAISHRSERFVLNAAPARDVPDELWARCEVVIMNEAEASAADLRKIAQCVVTLGDRGARLLHNGSVVGSVRPPAVTPIDTVGAGDAFCAAFAFRLANGDSPIEAMEYAVVAGAIATQSPGAQAGLPTDMEVRQWLDRAS
jgi:ribokinase